MKDLPFDMPDASHSFEARGGWLARRLAEVFQLELFQAAGFVGNPGFESGGFKTLQEMRPAIRGSRGGYGWSQWTGARRRAFEAWAAAHNLAVASDEANYGFMVEELRRSFAAMLSRLRHTKTIEEAAFLVGRVYEAPGGTTDTHLPGYEGRLHYARRALAGAAADRSNPLPQSGEGLPPSPTRDPAAVIDAIKALQIALTPYGYAGKIDGDFGGESLAAMAAFRRGR